MRKTHQILKYLDGCTNDQHISEIAAAIGEADAVNQVGALCAYLRGKGHIASGRPGYWRITPAGSKWFRALAEDDDEPATGKTDKRIPPRKNAGPGPMRKAKKPAGEISTPLRKNGTHTGTPALAHSIQLPAIEHDVPITPALRAGAYRELAEQMAVGDSVLFPTDSKAANLRAAMRKLGFGSIQRQSKEGCRVWRIQ